MLSWHVFQHLRTGRQSSSKELRGRGRQHAPEPAAGGAALRAARPAPVSELGEGRLPVSDPSHRLP
eukprot:8497745-Alexandrium_andersonii.AAC.1